jgi:beta-exotoxin I transport system permease protein
MLRDVFTKSLRDQRWALLGWSIGMVLLVLVECAVWPTMRDMPNLDELLEGYPDAMKDLFDLDAMSTATGFLNAELFTLMLPMLFIIFAVSRGARMIAGEEERGTLDAVLVTRVSCTTLVLQKAAALATSVAVLAVVLFVVTLGLSPVFGMGLRPSAVATGALAMALLGLEFGFVALAVGAVTGRRGVALGVGGSLAVAGYVLYALGQIVDSFKPWQPLSPFHQTVADGPLGGGVPLSFAWPLLVALVVVAGALPVFDRRDLRTV